MTGTGDAIAARWRRLETGIQQTNAAVASADPSDCVDAVARTLDALYDLWEVWRLTSGRSGKAQDDYVAGNSAGETTAALVFARGGKTHDLIDFGDFTDTISETFFDHWGAWRWQLYSDPDPRYARRNAWYQSRVAHEEVMSPLKSAVAWLRTLPELR